MNGGDYYRFVRGRRLADAAGYRWMNQHHGDVGRPVFWHGALADGQSARFRVFVLEQDNRDWSTIRKAISDALGGPLAATPGKTPWAAAVVAGGKLVLPLTPDDKDHDMLGAIGVDVTNKSGVITVSTTAPENVVFKDVKLATAVRLDRDSPRAQELVRSAWAVDATGVVFNATNGGHYTGILTVRTTPTPAGKARRVAVIDHDWTDCDSQPLRVLAGEKRLIAVGDSDHLTGLAGIDKLDWVSEVPTKPVQFQLVGGPNGLFQKVSFATQDKFRLPKGTTAVSLHRPPAGVESAKNQYGTRMVALFFQEEEYGKPAQR